MQIFNEKGKLNLEILSKVIERPELFSHGDRQNFWDDEHISKNMLEAHLMRDSDAGSRKYETIKNICKWIVETLELEKGMKLIDLGCGPGLYCEELYNYGLDITGVDYSKRSIDYAKNHAEECKMDISYFYKNYLTLDYENEFDVAILVYYDFSCFTEADTKKLLEVIYRLLKKGGCFVFDVQTPNKEGLEKEVKTWSIEKGGFWNPNNHIELYQKLYFPDYYAEMEQYIIIDEDGNMDEFRLWELHYYLKDLEALMKEAGFTIEGVYNDLTGTPYSDDSSAMGLIVRK